MRSVTIAVVNLNVVLWTWELVCKSNMEDSITFGWKLFFVPKMLEANWAIPMEASNTRMQREIQILINGFLSF